MEPEQKEKVDNQKTQQETVELNDIFKFILSDWEELQAQHKGD